MFITSLVQVVLVGVFLSLDHAVIKTGCIQPGFIEPGRKGSALSLCGEDLETGGLSGHPSGIDSDWWECCSSL